MTASSHLKALILAGGSGTRLRPLTYAMAKQLVPVANKPILLYGLDALYAVGIRDMGIIISPETGADIKTVVASWQKECEQYHGEAVSVTFIEQDKPLGLAHAVKTAQPYLLESPFAMYLGDNLINADLKPWVDAFLADTSDARASILLKPVENPSSFGVAELRPDGGVKRLVEKPVNPPSNLALVGVYLFQPTIFDAIDAIQPSPRGELEITDAIQALIDGGHRVDCKVHEGWWLDTGKKDDLLSANQTILSDWHLAQSEEAAVMDNVTHEGRVLLGKNVTLRNCELIGPISLGDNVTIENATIGPYASIGAGSVIQHSHIEHSVLLNRCEVTGLDGRLSQSLMGHECVVTGSSHRSEGDANEETDERLHTLVLADHSQVTSAVPVRV